MKTVSDVTRNGKRKLVQEKVNTFTGNKTVRTRIYEKGWVFDRLISEEVVHYNYCGDRIVSLDKRVAVHKEFNYEYSF